MEMMVNIIGVGVAVPKTGFGVNLVTGSYIGFRHSESHYEVLLGLEDIISLGSRSGAVLLGWIKTKYFVVDTVIYPWALHPKALIGSKAEIEVDNTLVGLGSVDIKFTLFTNGGDGIPLISKVDIESMGIQLANTKVRGTLCKIM